MQERGSEKEPNIPPYTNLLRPTAMQTAKMIR